MKVINDQLTALRARARASGIDLENNIANLVSLERSFHTQLQRSNPAGYAQRVLRYFEGATTSSDFIQRMNTLATQLLRDSGKVN
jgi:hypothetical protein